MPSTWFMILSPAVFPSVNGRHDLNQWTISPGYAICKHPEALMAAMQQTGSFIAYSEKRDSMLYTPEMSRRGRAIELWASLKVLGKSGIEELVDGLCARAQQVAEQLKAEGFQVLNEVVFDQVLVTGKTPGQTGRFLKHLRQSGEAWCGGANWHGQPVIRISVCSWATTPADIERLVTALVTARERS